jgi:peroxiredoxin Q/BCP
MRRPLAALLATCLLASQAFAALPNGAQAPVFTTQASLGGQVFAFSLADALKKGPVVLYFYPAAFTSGCTEEAHRFAEATDKFAALGATVIGVSQDKIEVLNKFSVSECRSKFAVASDADGRITKSYDAKRGMIHAVTGYNNRISYVIAPSGEILYSYEALAPDKHVENTMDAVRKYRETHPKG